MMTELLRPGYSFSGTVMFTELEVSIEKKKVKCFCLKILQLFYLTFLQERKENYISIQREHSIPLKQLLVKEMLVNRPWRLDFLVPQRSVLLLKLAKCALTISVFCLIPCKTFLHELIENYTRVYLSAE